MPIYAILERKADDFADGLNVEFSTGIQFPIAPDELRKKLDKLWFTPDNIDQFAITNADYSHDEYTTEIENRFPESVSLIDVDKLNHLAVLLDGLSNDDRPKGLPCSTKGPKRKGFRKRAAGWTERTN